MSKEKGNGVHGTFGVRGGNDPVGDVGTESPQPTDINAGRGDEAGDLEEDYEASRSLEARTQQAQTHYRRLRGIGYEHAKALAFVNDLYKLADSYRDVLLRRQKKPTTPAPLAPGFQQQSAEDVVEVAATPTVGQKIVTQSDMGRVAFIGSRFVSIEWLKSGKRERIAISRFKELVTVEQVAMLPQVRTAQRIAGALRGDV